MDWGIVGHEEAVSLLRRSVASGRLAHAHLFTGPPQIGKTALALALARALNCRQADPPCGTCSSCDKTLRRIHPDVQVIDGAGVSESIKIDQIRALHREVALAPYEGRYRVVVVRQADKATLEAANSLLKTLEEPPPHVVLVLTAANPEALPPTLVSRCQRLDLRPVSAGAIEAALVARGEARERAHLIAQLSGGRAGWALQARKEPLIEQRRQHLDMLTGLLAGDRLARLQFAASKGVRDVEVARRLIDLWATWWRDLLLVCGQNEAHVLNVDRMEELRRLAGRSSVAQARSMLEVLRETATQLEANVNVQLALEGLLLKLPHWRQGMETGGAPSRAPAP